MKATETEHKDAGKFAWFAFRDASLKSAVNASLFTDSQKIKAERVKLALELVYVSDAVTVTNCKKWIRVKVQNGNVRDRKNLRLLESDWAKEGITKSLTKQGIIYHVI